MLSRSHVACVFLPSQKQRKNTSKLGERNEQRSRNCKLNWKTKDRQSKQKRPTRRELDLEIRALREGAGGRGSNASQSCGYCFVQRSSSLQHSKVNSTGCLMCSTSQPTAHHVLLRTVGQKQPATEGAGEEWEEEQRKSVVPEKWCT